MPAGAMEMRKYHTVTVSPDSIVNALKEIGSLDPLQQCSDLCQIPPSQYLCSRLCQRIQRIFAPIQRTLIARLSQQYLLIQRQCRVRAIVQMPLHQRRLRTL